MYSVCLLQYNLFTTATRGRHKTGIIRELAILDGLIDIEIKQHMLKLEKKMAVLGKWLLMSSDNAWKFHYLSV